tara:strand:- start:4109 stop:4474 length:366 start_codon:yes stop_codon:yes gene_type:complete
MIFVSVSCGSLETRQGKRCSKARDQSGGSRRNVEAIISYSIRLRDSLPDGLQTPAWRMMRSRRLGDRGDSSAIGFSSPNPHESVTAAFMPRRRAIRVEMMREADQHGDQQPATTRNRKTES